MMFKEFPDEPKFDMESVIEDHMEQIQDIVLEKASLLTLIEHAAKQSLSSKELGEQFVSLVDKSIESLIEFLGEKEAQSAEDYEVNQADSRSGR